MIVKCSNCVLKWKKTGLRARAVNFLGPSLVSRAPFRESLSSASPVIWGFKKLRRPLKRRSRIKVELCVKLSVLQLFHVGHVVQNRPSALSLACDECFSCIGKG